MKYSLGRGHLSTMSREQSLKTVTSSGGWRAVTWQQHNSPQPWDGQERQPETPGATTHWRCSGCSAQQAELGPALWQNQQPYQSQSEVCILKIKQTNKTHNCFQPKTKWVSTGPLAFPKNTQYCRELPVQPTELEWEGNQESPGTQGCWELGICCRGRIFYTIHLLFSLLRLTFH